MDKELQEAAARFVSDCELLFDYDWEFTASRLDSKDYIEAAGTFLRPGVQDEENNWANRARVLESYRALRGLLENRGVPSPYSDSPAA